ncbi:hypothetical protein Poli38472_012973 [Pythium oligandrum]|uniref:UBR-type domain-containing protein n=1 Tax=Pythium oligandrum TaxID=41045 RepID=A0A8K1FIY9_PYTOL|nr:hypothetical protein Poli38472_012973 [Pythium oligandrum]|eukprot:TMW64351.1 hypothetical protein Poli38472_012973 [Pythium oligandrum]
MVSMSDPPSAAQNDARSAPTTPPATHDTESTSAMSSAPAPSKSAEETTPNGHEELDEEDDEEVVTLDEVLQEQSELNEAADAVLGDSSTDNCSYPMGYFRQPLYACLTCTKASPDDLASMAGVCLACSYHCHPDHELIELYTKREFRCDCGNSRFPNASASPCTLFAEKEPLNDRNKYSQNFAGQYCECHRPYPDPERTTPEVMVQCVVCEDWLHEEHIFPKEEGENATPPKLPAVFDELICFSCMEKHPFLLSYQLFEPVDGEDEPSEQETSGGCVLEHLEASMATKDEQFKKLRPTFWSREWRTRLCACSKCVARLEREQIAFLSDPEDSLQAYEERARQQEEAEEGAGVSTLTSGTASSDNTVNTNVAAAMSSMEQAAQRAFQSKLSHEQQVEMAMGYNHMKEKLQAYLSTFAANGKTVRAQDINGFFEELRQTKRPRLHE